MADPARLSTLRPGSFAALLQSPPEDPWDRGVSTYLRGEGPPDDPGEAEGWRWTENSLAQRTRMAGCLSRSTALVAFVGAGLFAVSLAGQLA